MKTETKRDTLRDGIQRLFASARKIRIGNTLYIGNDEEIQTRIRKAWRDGKIVEENGTKSWTDTVAIVNPSNTGGSTRYIWHTDGERVKARRFVVIQTDEKITRHDVGECWIKWEDA